MELQDELKATQEHLSRVRADMDLKDNELRQKSTELKTLTNKVKVHVHHPLSTSTHLSSILNFSVIHLIIDFNRGWYFLSPLFYHIFYHNISLPTNCNIS